MTPDDDLVSRLDAYSMRADRLERLERLAALVNEDPVRAWRRSRFLAMGCDSLLADLLAGSEVDPNAYAALVGCGCSYEAAARILL